MKLVPYLIETVAEIEALNANLEAWRDRLRQRSRRRDWLAKKPRRVTHLGRGRISVPGSGLGNPSTHGPDYGWPGSSATGGGG